MRLSGLSFESMPSPFVPLRFFLTAPIFAILAAILFFYDAGIIVESRWSQETLAIVHLMTLGFMLMSMTGALFQFIPVMTGYVLPASQKMVPIIYFSLVFGCLFLTAGFLLQNIILFQISAILLSLYSLLFMALLSFVLVAIKSKKEAIFILRIVNFSLFITLGIGFFMLLAYSFKELGIVYHLYTDIHVMWALLGWTILLLLAVSSQVIPMFHVTPRFSPQYLKIISIFFLLCLMTISILSLNGGSHILLSMGKLLLSCCVLVYALYSLLMISKRKRKVKDMSINFWRFGLLLLVFVVFLYWFNNLLTTRYAVKLELLIGLLFIFGFACSCIIGMMQKIVPFIIYMHLQRRVMMVPEKMSLLPNMQELISVKNQQIQFYLHLSSLCLLSMSIFFEQLGIFAATMMLINFIWLAYNIYYSAQQYWLINQQLLNVNNI